MWVKLGNSKSTTQCKKYIIIGITSDACIDVDRILRHMNDARHVVEPRSFCTEQSGLISERDLKNKD
ncbi:hypothetical protein GJ496_006137 [Pomphorhynchus laevis]|nr:hypothetical protein GJ496_006137 [Pomphorhynchus laevis]